MTHFAGRVALVTGSSRGIGRATAVALARAGAHVVINFQTRFSDAEEAAAEVREAGRECIAVQADVSQAADVERLVRVAYDQLGSVDILVNNAGVSRPQEIDEIAERDWDELVTTNLKSCFLVTQAVLPGMRRRQWGRIVNISSVAAHVGGIVGPHYAASKAGMLGLTHFYASRLAGEGITVNAVAPALIETEMIASNANARPDRIPVGRFGSVDEVADLVVGVASNGYITGQTIHVNGGWYMT
jgi:3-oxoacyl-[acyl-carrier protein] reductase